MALHHRGFRPERLAEQPEGYPPIGEEFEYEWPPVGPHCSDFGCVHIDTFRVTGWERQLDELGNARISVRVWPIARRTRRVTTFGVRTCDLGHVHEVFEYDDNTPIKGEAPQVWGTGE